MSKLVKIKEIQNNKINLTNGKSSSVFEFFPEDCEQKDDLETRNYYGPIVNFLNQVNIDSKKFCSVKFYKLDGRNFINADEEVCNKFPIKKEEFSELGEYFFDAPLASESKFINCEDFFKINSKYFRIITLYETLPEVIGLNCLEPLGDYLVTYKKINKTAAISSMKFKRNIFFSLKGKVKKDAEADNAYEAADETLENLQTGRESLFQTEVYIILKADTEDELQNKTKLAKLLLDELSCSFNIEAEGLTELAPTLLFGIEPLMMRSLPSKSTYLKNLLPLTRDYVHDEGTMFFSQNLNPVNVSLFDKSCSNYNAFFSGKSGQGKSVCGQKVVSDEYRKGAGGIIIDLGGSALKYSLYTGARIFDGKINPLQFKSPSYLQGLVLSVIPEREITEKLKGKIFFLIKKFLELERTTLQEFVDYLETEIEDIKYYFEPLWDFVTDEELEINRFIYVDCKVYPKEIYKTLIVYFFEYFKHIPGRRILTLDEAWNYLVEIGEEVESNGRQIRKEDASQVLISQNVDDLLQESKAGKAFIQNCCHWFLFNQTVLDNNFLSQEDKSKISNCLTKNGEYSEFYYKNDSSRKILRYYQSPFEYHLFTTYKPHNQRMDNFFKSLGPNQKFSECFDLYVRTFN